VAVILAGKGFEHQSSFNSQHKKNVVLECIVLFKKNF